MKWEMKTLDADDEFYRGNSLWSSLLKYIMQSAKQINLLHFLKNHKMPEKSRKDENIFVVTLFYRINIWLTNCDLNLIKLITEKYYYLYYMYITCIIYLKCADLTNEQSLLIDCTASLSSWLRSPTFLNSGLERTWLRTRSKVIDKGIINTLDQFVAS